MEINTLPVSLKLLKQEPKFKTEVRVARFPKKRNFQLTSLSTYLELW